MHILLQTPSETVFELGFGSPNTFQEGIWRTRVYTFTCVHIEREREIETIVHLLTCLLAPLFAQKYAHVFYSPAAPHVADLGTSIASFWV